MKNFFKTNWITLSISLLSAILIWIYVVYQINPIFETTVRNLPVSYVKYSDAFATGKLVVASESVETANVKIKGKRSNLSKLSKEDIICTVDMSGVTSSGTHKIPIGVSFNASGIELVSKDPYSVIVAVDDVKNVKKARVIVDVQIKLSPSAEDIKSFLKIRKAIFFPKQVLPRIFPTLKLSRTYCIKSK